MTCRKCGHGDPDSITEDGLCYDCDQGQQPPMNPNCFRELGESIARGLSGKINVTASTARTLVLAAVKAQKKERLS